MNTVNKTCELCKDDWQGKRPPSTFAYFIGNATWRGICDKHAEIKRQQGTFVVTIAALLNGSEIKMEK